MSDRKLDLKQRGLNFEMLMWIFTRISALGMYLFILVGIIGALVMGARTHMNMADVLRWGFMPNISHVSNTELVDIAPWETIYWQLIGSVLLLLAVSHGVHGLVSIADDYFTTPGGRKAVRLISIVMVAFFSLVGLGILWNYKPF
ncbi:MAG TPA: hypothetical protein VN226_01345 [Anaerolineales bacterium]|nr:hypothetical protein [Anaerolineales bacterium]